MAPRNRDRSGYIRVSDLEFDDGLTPLLFFMMDFHIRSAVQDMKTKTIEYAGYCDQFTVVPEGNAAPEYSMDVSYDQDGDIVAVTAIPRNLVVSAPNVTFRATQNFGAPQIINTSGIMGDTTA